MNSGVIYETALTAFGNQLNEGEGERSLQELRR